MLSQPLSPLPVHISISSADNANSNTRLLIDSRYLSYPLNVEVPAGHLRHIEETILQAQPLASHVKPHVDRSDDIPSVEGFSLSELSKVQLTSTSTYSIPRELRWVLWMRRLCVYGCPNV